MTEEQVGSQARAAHKEISEAFEDLAAAALEGGRRKSPSELWRDLWSHLWARLRREPTGIGDVASLRTQLLDALRSLRKYDFLFGGAKAFLREATHSLLYWRLRELMLSPGWGKIGEGADLGAVRAVLTRNARRQAVSEYLNDISNVLVPVVLLASFLTAGWLGHREIPGHRYLATLDSSLWHIAGVVVGAALSLLVFLVASVLFSLPSRSASNLALLTGILGPPVLAALTAKFSEELIRFGLSPGLVLGMLAVFASLAALSLFAGVSILGESSLRALHRLSDPESFLDWRLRRVLGELDESLVAAKVGLTAGTRQGMCIDLASARETVGHALPRYFSGKGVAASKVLERQFEGAAGWLAQAQCRMAKPRGGDLRNIRGELQDALVALACQDWAIFPSGSTDEVIASGGDSKWRRFGARFAISVGWASLAYFASFVSLEGFEEILKTAKLVLLAGAIVSLLSATEELASPDGTQSSIAKDMLGRLIGR